MPLSASPRTATSGQSEDQRTAAPSVFAEGKHANRSERYTYIPTIEVLRGLCKEGFEPYMVAQGASRVEGKEAFTKHMIRMRHAGQTNGKAEANEIILINRCYGGWKSPAHVRSARTGFRPFGRQRSVE